MKIYRFGYRFASSMGFFKILFIKWAEISREVYEKSVRRKATRGCRINTCLVLCGVFNCTLCSIVQCAVSIPHCSEHCALYVVYSVQCTVYSVQCTVYSVQCTVYSVQCTVYSVQWGHGRWQDIPIIWCDLAPGQSPGSGYPILHHCPLVTLL